MGSSRQPKYRFFLGGLGKMWLRNTGLEVKESSTWRTVSEKHVLEMLSHICFQSTKPATLVKCTENVYI